MLTQCPTCSTTFRVTPEQIKIRAGRVRCGQCQHAFNAIDTLIEESPAVVAPPLTPTLTSPPDPTLPAVAAWTEPAFTIDTTVSEVSIPPPEPALEETNDPPSITTTTEIVEQPEPLADSLLTEPTHEEPLRWPWVIGALLAILCILMQAVVAFRVELAVLVPDARPELTQLCDLVGCEVGLPQKAELLSIETSDLHPDINPDPEKKGRLTLTATLKNRAPFAQTLPHLELTLTDTADKAIARKVLKPAEYLPPKTTLAAGMAANADLTVAVDIDPGELPASGYRLYLFYP
jgi:predicted Zn finger-like uncharacterized protein